MCLIASRIRLEWLLIGVCLTSGCDRDSNVDTGPRPVQGAEPAEPAPPARDETSPTGDGPARLASPRDSEKLSSPIAVVRRVRQLRAEGKFGPLADYLAPAQRDAVIDHLLSVDRLVAAYSSLEHVIAERVGVGAASALNSGALANIVGVFSRDVEIFGERIDGDEAVVMISVAGRLPLEELKLIRRDGRWLLWTDPPVPELSGELDKLAKVADRVALEVKTRELTADDVQKEIALRQAPILRRIQALDERSPKG